MDGDDRHGDIGTESLILEWLLTRGVHWAQASEVAYMLDTDADLIEEALDGLQWEQVIFRSKKRLRLTACARHVNLLIGPMIERQMPDPLAEPAEFYALATAVQARGETLHGRTPEARHLEMLRLRLVEGLSYQGVAERTGVTKERVRQILNVYFRAAGRIVKEPKA
jgi:hypothetical protein